MRAYLNETKRHPNATEKPGFSVRIPVPQLPKETRFRFRHPSSFCRAAAEIAGPRGKTLPASYPWSSGGVSRTRPLLDLFKPICGLNTSGRCLKSQPGPVGMAMHVAVMKS